MSTIDRNVRLRIGDLLIQAGLLKQEGLDKALAEQRASGKKIGRVLTDLGLVSEEQIARTIANQLKLEYVPLVDVDLPQEATRVLSEIQARRFRSIAIKVSDKDALIGMVDPTDFSSLDEIARILKREVNTCVVTESDVFAAIDRSYRKLDEINDLARELKTEVSKTNLQDVSDALGLGSASAEDAPVVRLLATVFEEAVRMRASDIHVEPMESSLRIRFRIDGELHVQTESDASIAAAVALRLKLAAQLNISEKRMPQDGRMKISLPTGAVDVRVSTMPTQYGESVVMRLLNQGSMNLQLSSLGLSERMSKAFMKALSRPSGMILVTGPTGSGKTTTLYGALGEINTTRRKVITVEDPIEYRLPGLTQVQVNDKIELGFDKVLRSALRQDPDVVLVGEIRDNVTSEIAMRAAMTGHLVLSTIHSNDATSTPMRLLDMGVPSYMVALSLQLIIAQRLVKKLCTRCSVPHEASDADKKWIDSTMGQDEYSTEGVDLGRLRRPVGCKSCHQTGYTGRQPVFEFIEMNRTLVEALSHENPNEFVERARTQMAGYTMARDALELALKGVTSVEEAMSVDNSIDD
jgi:MSHA biogenesis protein MshE